MAEREGTGDQSRALVEGTAGNSQIKWREDFASRLQLRPQHAMLLRGWTE